MNTRLKYGEEFFVGRWHSFTDYVFYDENNEKLKIGSIIKIEMNDVHNYYFSYMKKNDISFYVVNGRTYKFKIKPEFILFDYSSYYYNFQKFIITKITEKSVFVKMISRTVEYNKNSDIISKNGIRDTEIEFSKFNFKDIAYQSDGDKHINYYKIYSEKFSRDNNESYRFRVDSIEDDNEKHYYYDWFNRNKHYWNFGMSHKGLYTATWRKIEDEQLLSYDDNDESIIVIIDSRTMKRFFNHFHFRNPHKKSWKECTKKRKQWMK